MLIISTLAASLAKGLPVNSIGWICLFITLAGSMIVYFAQSFAWPTTSTLGNVNLADFAKGLLLSIGAGLSSWAASAMTSTTVSYKTILTLMVTILLGYIAKTFAQNSSGQLAQPESVKS